MKRFIAMWSIFAVTSATAAPVAQPVSVEVFTNTATYVPIPASAPYSLQVYRLDAMVLIEEQLNQGLPSNEHDALAALQRIEGEIRRKYQDQIINASNGMTLAIHYRLDRLPAVVINRQAVIYGVPDVQQAVAIYMQSTGVRP